MIHTYFIEGRESYHKGIEINPYPPESEAARSWDAGYTEEWFIEYYMKENK